MAKVPAKQLGPGWGLNSVLFCTHLKEQGPESGVRRQMWSLPTQE